MGWLIGLLVVCGVSGAFAATAPETVVARVNAAEILQGDLDFIITTFVLPQLQAQGQEITAEQRTMLEQRILDQLVLQRLIAQEAVRLNIKADTDAVQEQVTAVQESIPDVAVDKLTKLFTDDMAAQQVVQQEVVAKITVSDEEAQDFYDKNPEIFTEDEQVQASHILVKVNADATQADKDAARKKIDDVLAQAKAGTDFAELAKTNSDDSSKDQGGDLGFFSRGMMVQPFEDVAFALKEGEISEVVETQFGYHIIKSTGHKAASQTPFAEIKDQLKQSMIQEKTNAEINTWLTVLRENATIEMLLPPPVPTDVPTAAQ